MLTLSYAKSIVPYLADVNVTYSNATGLFSAEVVSVSRESFNIAYTMAVVTNWMFRVTEVRISNNNGNS